MAKTPNKKIQGNAIEAKTPSVSKVTKSEPISITPTTSKSKISFFNLALIILTLVTVIAYFNTLFNGFVLDDVMVLKDNVYVKQGIAAIPEIFATPHMRGYLIIPNDMYRPLSLAMFAVEYQFFGENATFAHHFFNIITFAGCVLLFFVFLDKFFYRKKTMVAFFAALLFALHPLHTEVVANIKSRDELLCFFFAFLTLNLMIGYMNKGNIFKLILSLFTLYLSYLSKETVVTFLGVIPLLFFFYINENRKRAIYITLGTIGITVCYLLVRAYILKIYNADNHNTPIAFIDNALTNPPSAIHRIATEILIMGYYLKLHFIPYPLLLNYSYNSIPFVTFANIGVLLTIVVYGAMLYFGIIRLIKHKKDPWAFGIWFYLMTISLFSNFVFLGGAALAERFAFFASAGICILMALAINEWITKNAVTFKDLKKPTVFFTILPLCVVFLGMTVARNTDWKTSSNLYKVDCEKSPDDSRLHYYYGTSLAEGVYESEQDTVNKHNIDKESIEHLSKSIEIYPDFTDANAEIGRVYIREQKFDLAEGYVKHALELDSTHVKAINNLGNVYLGTKRYAQAIGMFQKVVDLRKDTAMSVMAYFNMALAYMQMQQYDLAIRKFRIVMNSGQVIDAKDPQNANISERIGMCYFYKQSYDSAIINFNIVYKLNPNNADASNNIGASYLNSKKYAESIEWFKKSLSVNPKYVSAYSNLGMAYYSTGQYALAFEAFKKEIELAPGAYTHIPNMAVCCKALGNLELAAKYEVLAKKYFPDFHFTK